MPDKIPDDRRYTKDHEWIRAEGAEAIIGITAFAVEQLGDVTLVDLPAAGGSLLRGQVFGTVESVKAVSDLFAPVNGEVLESNAALASTPEKVNDDPYGAGWMLRVRVADGEDTAALLTAAQYAALLRESEG